ncbi:MAG: hydroxymethylbilane synthase [Nitrososphaerales archaeon]
MNLIVGTRGSKLSLIQTERVIRRLEHSIPNLGIEVKVIKTAGDRFMNKPLTQFKRKGIFEREIDKAIIKGDIDFAVHSMKDLPTSLPKGLIIASVPKRDSPYDVLITKNGSKLKDLPKGAIIGTSSIRREAQIRFVRPDLEIKPIRGNVDTRIKKLKEGQYDAIILAEAGIKKLNMGDFISERLSLKQFTPAPGQGALALVTMEENSELLEILKRINHEPSMAEVLAERALIKKIGGGCKAPIGAIARARKNSIHLRACTFSSNGKTKIEIARLGSIDAPEDLGVKVAEDLINLGAKDVIKEWRSLYESW